MKRLVCVAIAGGLTLALGVSPAWAEVDSEAVNAAQKEAIAYLRATQNENGSWTSPKTVGITAVVATGLLDAGLTADDEVVSEALAFMKKHVQDDGGIYHEGSRHRNYETAIALMALTRANKDGRFDEVIAGATKFLKGLQWDEGEDVTKSDAAYGGAGYGHSSRPDLSNTSFFVEALRNTGVAESDPAMQKALIFISRCQNRESQYNTLPFAAKVNDGGFYYTCVGEGESEAGTTDNGGLRSYGSMTYSGLKSLIYAGLDQEDPRAQAALDWAQAHYTVEANPGMGASGLYYYYQAFAKALDAMDVKTVTDDEGDDHNWREDLAEELLDRQNENGSWVNEKSSRWLEGDPNLVTGYVLMTLHHVAAPEKGESVEK